MRNRSYVETSASWTDLTVQQLNRQIASMKERQQINILELVTDSEIVAKALGGPNDLQILAGYISSRIAGKSHGSLYEQVYALFYNVGEAWAYYREEDKPTLHSLFVLISDLLINGD